MTRWHDTCQRDHYLLDVETSERHSRALTAPSLSSQEPFYYFIAIKGASDVTVSDAVDVRNGVAVFVQLVFLRCKYQCIFVVINIIIIVLLIMTIE